MQYEAIFFIPADLIRKAPRKKSLNKKYGEEFTIFIFLNPSFLLSKYITANRFLYVIELLYNINYVFNYFYIF